MKSSGAVEHVQGVGASIHMHPSPLAWPSDFGLFLPLAEELDTRWVRVRVKHMHTAHSMCPVIGWVGAWDNLWASAVALWVSLYQSDILNKYQALTQTRSHTHTCMHTCRKRDKKRGLFLDFWARSSTLSFCFGPFKSNSWLSGTISAPRHGRAAVPENKCLPHPSHPDLTSRMSVGAGGRMCVLQWLQRSPAGFSSFYHVVIW